MDGSGDHVKTDSVEERHTLVGLGEVLWDVLPNGKQLGGAPANFAYHAQALGGNGIVVSCVGDDGPGREILARLDDLGLDRRYVATDKNHPTGTVTVELDAVGKPAYTIHENVAWDYIPYNSGLEELAGEVDAVCFGSLCQRSRVSRETIRQFLEVTKRECLRLFDLNLRQSYFNREIIDTLLKLTDVLKLNDEELPFLAELCDVQGSETRVLHQLTERYALRLVALTRAERGSRLFTPGRDSDHPGFRAQVADTVGAGDSFAAVLALGLLRGEQLDRINEYANRVASFVCSQNGATPPLPSELIKIPGEIKSAESLMRD
ncbi:MAG: carbohydrate kinase [Candidatus Neomarinimicrobiota bacterium]